MVRELRRLLTRAVLARVGAVGACATLLCGMAGPALARDGDEPRGYLAIRGFDTNPITGVRDYWGVSLGGNYNRYLGGELSLDSFERRMRKLTRDHVPYDLRRTFMHLMEQAGIPRSRRMSW